MVILDLVEEVDFGDGRAKLESVEYLFRGYVRHIWAKKLAGGGKIFDPRIRLFGKYRVSMRVEKIEE